MAGIKTIVFLSFILSVGLLMVILASALNSNWWPMLSFGKFPIYIIVSSTSLARDLAKKKLCSILTTKGQEKIFCSYFIAAYILAIFPNLFCTSLGNTGDDFFDSNSRDEGSLAEVGYFLTTSLLVAGCGIPVIQSHADIITPRAAMLSSVGGALIYATVISYSYFFSKTENHISL